MQVLCACACRCRPLPHRVGRCIAHDACVDEHGCAKAHSQVDGIRWPRVNVHLGSIARAQHVDARVVRRVDLRARRR
eukprot:65743-Chlamydomonas_euryale.AAC.1